MTDENSELEIQKVDSKFFDLDDIIAKSESTSCTFEVGELSEDFFNEMLGVTKPTQNADGYCLDTPLWLIDSVRTNRFIQLPQSYSVNMQSVLNADARNVNLARLEQHFYSNGMQLCHLMKNENPEGAHNLSKCLLSTLTQRLGEIVSNAAHSRNKADKLDSLETRIFLEGKKCKTDIDNWLRQETSVGTSKKRKRNS